MSSVVKTSAHRNAKLRRYLELASSVHDIVGQVTAKGAKMRQAEAQDLTVRDRVLIGLAVKAYNSFECLIHDAAALRSEAFHHLKTLAETHIYFQWVGVKTDDTRARLVLAEECRCKISFYDANPNIGLDKSTRDSLKRRRQALTQGLEHEWKDFKRFKIIKLAEDTSADMTGWYNRVYKTACEPAHISDLSEYMPPTKGSIRLTPAPELSTLRALIALDFGLQITLDLLRNLSDIYELGFQEPITQLKATIDAARKLPAS